MFSSARGSRRGVVHVIDALVAIMLLTSILLGALYLIAAKNSTGSMRTPNPEALDAYIRARLESGEWEPYLGYGDAASIREEILILYQNAEVQPKVRVAIYVLNPDLGAMEEWVSYGDAMPPAYSTLRYFTPVSGHYGELYLVLEVRVYWP